MADIPETQQYKPRPASAASDDEARIFEDVIRSIGPLPDGVRRVEYRLGEDSYDDPAVRIIFVAGDDLKPSKQKLDDYHRVTREVISAIRRSDSDRWPSAGRAQHRLGCPACFRRLDSDPRHPECHSLLVSTSAAEALGKVIGKPLRPPNHARPVP